MIRDVRATFVARYAIVPVPHGVDLVASRAAIAPKLFL